MGRYDKHKISMILHHQTEKALFVSLDGDEKEAVWLPKSQVIWQEDEDDEVVVECPEWLLIEKELF